MSRNVGKKLKSNIPDIDRAGSEFRCVLEVRNPISDTRTWHQYHIRYEHFYKIIIWLHYKQNTDFEYKCSDFSLSIIIHSHCLLDSIRWKKLLLLDFATPYILYVVYLTLFLSVLFYTLNCTELIFFFFPLTVFQKLFIHISLYNKHY